MDHRKTLEKIMESVQCAICTSTMLEPRTLPCSHCFCGECLAQMVKSTIVKEDGIVDTEDLAINCPTCRKKHDNILSLSNFTSCFPLKNLLGTLMPSNDECNVRFCINCWKSPSGSSESCQCSKDFVLKKVVDDEIRYVCINHKLAIEYFCATCKWAICLDCLLKDHQSHTVKTVPRARDEIIHISETCKSIADGNMKSCQNLDKEINHAISTLQNEYNRAEIQINHLQLRALGYLCSLFDEKKEEIKTEFEAKKTAILDQFELDLEDSTEIIDKFNATKKDSLHALTFFDSINSNLENSINENHQIESRLKGIISSKILPTLAVDNEEIWNSTSSSYASLKSETLLHSSADHLDSYLLKSEVVRNILADGSDSQSTTSDVKKRPAVSGGCKIADRSCLKQAGPHSKRLSFEIRKILDKLAADNTLQIYQAIKRLNINTVESQTLLVEVINEKAKAGSAVYSELCRNILNLTVKVGRILDKLSSTNIPQISQEIKYLDIKTVKNLEILDKIIHERAISEAGCQAVYDQLCRDLNLHLRVKLARILDRLTSENIVQISKEIRRSLDLQADEDRILLDEILHERAISEIGCQAVYARLWLEIYLAISEIGCEAVYARLCSEINRGRVFPINGMLNRCKAEFERKTSNQLILEEDESESFENTEEKKRSRGRFLRNLSFMGELFRITRWWIEEDIFHACVTKLLDDENELSLEGLCILLTKIGMRIEVAKVDQYIHKIRTIVQEKRVCSRVVEMLKDLQELRGRNWEAPKM